MAEELVETTSDLENDETLSNHSHEDDQERGHALFSAAFNGRFAAVKQLLDDGADVSWRRGDGMTALHAAAQGGHESIAKLLLDRRADPLVASIEPEGCTALHVAALNGHIGIAELLLDHGSEATIGGPNGISALHAAAQGGRADQMVPLLLSRGADPASVTDSGETAIHIAAQMGHENAVSALIKYRADPNVLNNEGEDALHIAATNGHRAVIQVLAQNKSIDLCGRNKLGLTALHIVASKGNDEVVRLLIQHHYVEVSPTSQDGLTPLLLASGGGHEEVVKFLLESGATVSEKDNDGLTALHFAARHGHRGVVEMLLKSGASVSAGDEANETALHSAIRGQHSTIIRFLLERGAEVARPFRNKETPFIFSVSRDYVEVANILLDYGADITSGINGFSALHIAAQEGQVAMAKMLINRGMDVHVKSSDGWTALHSAAAGGSEEVIQALIACGADILCATDRGWTVLHSAAERGHEGAFKLLVENDANKSAASEGWTPLHIAAEYGREEIVKFLLDRGVDVAEPKVDGETALHVATKSGQDGVVKILLSRGADASLVDRDGKSPLEVAREKGHKAVVKVLEDHQAKENSDITKLVELKTARTSWKSYKYQRLLDATKYIRLLHVDGQSSDPQVVSGSLHAAPLDNLPEYVAVSYTWGVLLDPEEIFIGDGVIKITQNLHSAIKRFRRTTQRVFWIDQICIDQTNQREKEDQIYVMSRVYSQAKSVFIWLDDHDESTKDSIEMARYVAESLSPKSDLSFWLYKKPGLSWMDTWRPLARLYSRRWFSRLWVVQEFALGCANRIFCGDFEIPLRLLLPALTALTKDHPIWHLTLFFNRERAFENMNNLLRMLEIREDPNLRTIIQEGVLGKFDCQDPRDRIYGVLGLITMVPNLPKPNYTLEVRDVYLQFNRRFIDAGYGAEILALAGQERGNLSLDPPLPSWCLDWNSKDSSRYIKDQECVPVLGLSPRIATRSDQEWITADCYMVDKITKVGPALTNGSLVEIHERYLEWYKSSTDLVKSAMDSKYTTYATELQLWCTLLEGSHSPASNNDSEFMKLHNKISKREPVVIPLGSLVISALADTETTAPSDDNSNSADAVGTGVGADEQSRRLYFGPGFTRIVNATDCRVILTEKGYIGLASEITREGDSISVIFGVRYIKVLRPVEMRYKIVGNAFVLDVFNGPSEAAELSPTETTLC